MSDRTPNTLINLTYECLGTAQQMLNFLERLQAIAPHLVTQHDIHEMQQRVTRLRSLLQSAQKTTKG